MATNVDSTINTFRTAFSWRAAWYCVLIWILTFISAAVLIFPWFYLFLPFVVFWTTVYYFRKEERSLISGLRLSIFWFLVLVALDAISILGPYYANAVFYFSDLRNWFLFPLILLVPVIYSLLVENRDEARKKRHFKEASPSLS